MRFFVAVSFSPSPVKNRPSALPPRTRSGASASSSRGCLSDFEETEKKPETTVCGVSLEISRLATHMREKDKNQSRFSLDE
jgi:hypothetical protein